jgi:hypothetical protein
MRNALHERWRRDFDRLRSSRGNVDLAALVASWVSDRVWTEVLAKVQRPERLAWLGQLGVEAYDLDLGNIAAELRWNTQGIAGFEEAGGLAEVLRRHAGLLVASVADSLDFRKENVAAAGRAELRGQEHLAAALARGRGALLLGSYQSHPGHLLFHPGLAPLRLAALQHCESREFRHPVPLTAEGRVRLLPATAAAVRPLLGLLASGGCVVFYNDYLPPGATPARSPLFGRPVLVSRGVLSLAFRSGAPVVPFAVARQWPPERDEVRVELFPALSLPEPRPGEPAPYESAAHLLGAATECLIRRHPAAWQLWSSLRHRWAEAAEAEE